MKPEWIVAAIIWSMVAIVAFLLHGRPAHAEQCASCHRGERNVPPQLSEDVPFYCRPGSFAYVRCKPNGDIDRYYAPSSPYYRGD